MSTDSLLDPFDLRGLVLPNRVVMAPMTRARALAEIPDELTARYYGQRASAGLIITEGSPVSREGTGYLFTPGLYAQGQVAGWRRVTDAVHERGGRIFAQLWHAGRASHLSLQAAGAAPVSSTSRPSGYTAFAYQPDGTPGRVPASVPRALATGEVPRVAADFATAAANAHAAGFDGVELHGATQYLFEQFLNSEVNDRTDRYGAGAVADRIRFTLEVADAVIGEVGAPRVGIRLSPFSTVGNMPADSRTEETYRALGRELAARDLAYVHVTDTSGFGVDDDSLTRRLRALLRRMRPESGRTALVLAGGLERKSANELIDSGLIDLAAFGRPYIANPDLVERFRGRFPLATPDPPTFFGGGATGYVDYPASTDTATAPPPAPEDGPAGASAAQDTSGVNASVIAEFRAHGGRVGGRFAGSPLLLLHTTGARSGKEYVSPVVYLAEGDRYLVFAAKGGAETDPAWYHNLRAHPDTVVEIGAETVRVRAVEVRGAERDRLYARQAEIHPGFGEYQKRTSRLIPVVALEPVR